MTSVDRTTMVRVRDDIKQVVGEVTLTVKMHKEMKEGERIEIIGDAKKDEIKARAKFIGKVEARAGPSYETMIISSDSDGDAKKAKKDKRIGKLKPYGKSKDRKSANKENEASKRKREETEESVSKKSKIRSKRGGLVDEKLSRIAQRRSQDQPRKDGKFGARSSNKETAEVQHSSPRVLVPRLQPTQIKKY